ncbi:MAG: alpha-glucosidase/alpha-galactosidase [Lachnospiraceae bacterium]|jgi:alpha-galactosidase|nr:alpha-glucosidase/alpha-galactosidase [Lachnospiraceae bacterium]
MVYDGDNVRDLNVAYIGGGSRGWAWGFMMDLAFDSRMCGTVALYDIDRDAAQKNQIIGSKISEHPEARSPWRYLVAESLEQALRGADIVVISILPGTFAQMESDVHLPEKYGIYQPVGDTTGPGGLVRALRTVPMITQIAEAIRAYAPLAWVINYTNPMALCMAALYEAFPAIRAFGCCHEVFGTQNLLVAALGDILGIKGMSRYDIDVNVFGINHFTWFDAASYRGIDLFPVYRQFAEKYRETGYDNSAIENELNKNFVCFHRVKFDLFLRYGYIAAAGDRHLAEFCPPSWYAKDPRAVERWGFAMTPVSWRIEDLAQRLKKSAALVSGELPIEMKPSGEEGHLLIKALLGLGDIISNVNLPNRGQIGNLPLGAVVETNALFRRGEIRPVLAGDIPRNLAGLVSRHVCNQRLTLDAALHIDFEAALAALLGEPLAEGLSPADARTMLREMIGNTLAYLPAGWAAAINS